MTAIPAPRGLLESITDVAGYVCGFVAIYCGFSLLERIAQNTDFLIVRVSELEDGLRPRPAAVSEKSAPPEPADAPRPRPARRPAAMKAAGL